VYIAGHNRRIGRWTALVAAYAFVLNALLATTLLASVAPGKSLSGLELCTASVDLGHTQLGQDLDGQDKATKRAAIHCQICPQLAAPAALPPPAGLSLPLPVARDLRDPSVASETAPTQTVPLDHRPRGPPRLT
jgi:hypothetical protein